MRLKSFLPSLLFAALLIGVHLLARSIDKEFYLTQLTMSLYYALVVVSLCLVMGYAGQISLGHGAFFAIGGYSSAVLTTSNLTAYQDTAWAKALLGMHLLLTKPDLYGEEMLTVSPWAAFFVAMLLAGVVACLIGYPALRLKGHYLTMATLGFGLIVNKIILGSAILGSADGISSVPEWNIAGPLVISGKSATRVENYYVAGVLMMLLLFLLRNLVRSRVGRALQAIHDRETAANTMGINTSAYKLKAFVLSALITALAGVFFTHYTGGIGPGEAGAMKSVRYVALASAGGMTSLWSAAGVSTLINFLSLRGWFGTYDNAVFGALLILIISIAPEGPLKLLGQGFRRMTALGRAKRGGEHGAA